MSRLNAALYEDKDAYSEEVARLIQQDPASRPRTPRAVTNVSMAVLGQIIQIAGWQKLFRKYGQVFRKYGQDIIETIGLRTCSSPMRTGPSWTRSTP